MTKVAGVRFRNAGKIYFFDPGTMDLKAGMHVIVETARGVELGTVMADARDVLENEVIQPLKPVIRIATAEDEKTAERTGRKKKRRLRYVWRRSQSISWI